MAGSSASAVHQKQKDLSNQYKSHREAVTHLQSTTIDDVLPSLADEEDWDSDAQERAKAFLQDEATVFRFLRRARFDTDAAITLLSATLKWRIRTDLDMLSVASLHPLYTSPPNGRPPLLWMGSKFVDRFGRPCGLISLQSLERTQDRTLDECKEYIVACMEIVRRRIVELRARFQKQQQQEQIQDSSPSISSFSSSSDTQGPLQVVIAFDLLSSSMSNLELELLPFLLDLLKNHFPGMVGAVFVLHYGWVHAGMWGLAKRILPAQALAKIFFPNDAEFTEYFNPDSVPSELRIGGGTWNVTIDEDSNDVMTRLGRPTLQPGKAGGSVPSSPTSGTAPGSPTMTRKGHGISRGGSFESLADTYFSAAGTPRTGVSRQMTPRGSEPSTPRGNSYDQSGSLEMTPSAVKKLRMLQMTRGHSDTSTATIGKVNNERQRADSMRSRQQAQQQQPAQLQKGSSSNLRRDRSLRDFRLANEAIADDDEEDDSDSDVDSEKSGKTGEVNVDVRERTAGGSKRRRIGRLLSFSGWRRPSEERRQSKYSQVPVQGQQDPRACDDNNNAYECEEMMPSPQLQLPDDVLPTEPPIASTSSSRTLDPNKPPRFLSRRSRKLEKVPGAVSPYNASNPFWGYPAWIVPSSQGDDEHDDDESDFTGTGTMTTSQRARRASSSQGRPIQMTVRRRWRDLFRTLSYLFVLRILSLHRSMRWKVQHLMSRVYSLLPLLRNPPSSGTIEAMANVNNNNSNGSGSYDQRTERYRRLRAASIRGGGIVKRRSSKRRARTWLDSGNVTLALCVFAIALMLRLRMKSGFVRGLLASSSGTGGGVGGGGQ